MKQKILLLLLPLLFFEWGNDLFAQKTYLYKRVMIVKNGAKTNKNDDAQQNALRRRNDRLRADDDDIGKIHEDRHVPVRYFRQHQIRDIHTAGGRADAHHKTERNSHQNSRK